MLVMIIDPCLIIQIRSQVIGTIIFISCLILQVLIEVTILTVMLLDDWLGFCLVAQTRYSISLFISSLLWIVKQASSRQRSLLNGDRLIDKLNFWHLMFCHRYNFGTTVRIDEELMQVLFIYLDFLLFYRLSIVKTIFYSKGVSVFLILHRIG